MCDAGDAAELPFQRSGHGGSHGFRAGTRKAGADCNGREINLRKRGDGEKTESDDARKKDGHGDQRSRDGTLDKGSGEIGGKIHALVSVVLHSGIVNGIAKTK